LQAFATDAFICKNLGKVSLAQYTVHKNSICLPSMPAVTFATPAPVVPTHAGLWRAHELAGADASTLPTGYAALDAQLPGGGWPVGALIELLQDQSARHDWQLLLPALAARVRAHCGPVLLVGAPQASLAPFAPALAALGLPAERLLWVNADDAAARLWAAEQALRCAQVAAVLAWLPAVRNSNALGALRRLHMAAQMHSQLFFALRPSAVRHESSPAPLRLLLSGAGVGANVGVGAMQVDIIKRRGPALAQPLQLPTQQQRLQALLAATHARRARRAAQAGGAITLPAPIANLIDSLLQPTVPRPGHALDSVATRHH
jgi:protein ImuA